MLNESDFIAYYNSKILPELIIFEEYRKSQAFEYNLLKIARLLSISILFIIALLFFAYFFHINYFSKIFIQQILSNDIRIFCLINIIIIFIAIYAKKKMNHLVQDFDYAGKSQLYSKIINIYKNFSYYPLRGVDFETIYNSKLFSDFDELKSQDYIQGNYNNLSIRLSEVELIKIEQHQELRDNNYVVINQEKTIFQGLLIITTLNKNFSSETYIMPNAWLKFLNPLPHYLNRVVLEDPLFEKEFDVYSNNQVEARYLLTPSFMERLLQVDRLYQIRCCFKEQQMLMAVELNKNFFPDLSLSKPLDYNDVKYVFDRFNLIFSIINVLKLDMKIGL